MTVSPMAKAKCSQRIGDRNLCVVGCHRWVSERTLQTFPHGLRALGQFPVRATRRTSVEEIVRIVRGVVPLLPS